MTIVRRKVHVSPVRRQVLRVGTEYTAADVLNLHGAHCRAICAPQLRTRVVARRLEQKVAPVTARAAVPLAPTVAHALSLPGAIETRLRVTRRRCRVPHTAVRALRRLHGGTRHLQLSEVRRRRAAQTGPDAVRYPLRAALRAIARP